MAHRGPPHGRHDDEKGHISHFSRLRLYEEARLPVREHQGTPYPCRQRDLDGYVHFQRDNSRARYVSPFQAVNELCGWLDDSREPNASSMAALERLSRGLYLDPWGPDLIIMAFRDLDLAFFNGTLHGNTQIKWVGRTEWSRLLPGTTAYGCTGPAGHAQAQIRLSADDILMNPSWVTPPFLKVWQTTIHEMCVSWKRSQLPLKSIQTTCKYFIARSDSWPIGLPRSQHAYLFIRCGHDGNAPLLGDPQRASWAGGHGTLFRRCIHSVHLRAKRYLGLQVIGSRQNFKEHY